jgi:hypothetical protein
LYTKKDIELLLVIKKMLYEEKFTIEGVRQKLGKMSQLTSNEAITKEDIIDKVKYKLKEILKMLS